MCSDKQNIRVSEAVFQKKQRKEEKYTKNEKFTSRAENTEDDEKMKRLKWMHLQQQKHSLSWKEEDEDYMAQGLRIIVIQNMFSIEETTSICYYF